jgi:hypothetical protein
MKTALFFAPLFLVLSSAPCFSVEAKVQTKVISEEAVRNSSRIAYSSLLALVSHKGFHYPTNQIESGYRRNLEELKARLIGQGYVIEPCP